ncbi:MAG: hypothetical protein QXD83_06670, partial [Sulfolobales archaeon]
MSQDTAEEALLKKIEEIKSKIAELKLERDRLVTNIRELKSKIAATRRRIGDLRNEYLATKNNM